MPEDQQVDPHANKCDLATWDPFAVWTSQLPPLYAAVNGHLELPLLKDRQRFDAVSTSNLEVYKFRD